MAIVSVLEMHFRQDSLEQGVQRLAEVVAQTRRFDGCLRIEVVRSQDDPAKFLLYEEWESMEHDRAYRAFRQGEGRTDLRTYFDRDTVMTFWEPAQL